MHFAMLNISMYAKLADSYQPSRWSWRVTLREKKTADELSTVDYNRASRYGTRTRNTNKTIFFVPLHTAIHFTYSCMMWVE